MISSIFSALKATLQDKEIYLSPVLATMWFLFAILFYCTPCAGSAIEFQDFYIFTFTFLGVFTTFLLPVLSFIDNYKEVTRKQNNK